MSTDPIISWNRLTRLVIVVSLWGTLLMTVGCSQREPPNVLWITMDSLRPDHLGCYGYQRAHTPNIDALAREGFLFDACVAQAPYTHLSVPSMITGKYPRLVGVTTASHDLDDAQTTLAEILCEAGYFTVATPMSWKENLNQGFERVYPSSRSTPEKTQWCLETLAELNGRPFFIWLYYWDPHLPYTPPVEFMRAYEPTYSWNGSETKGRPRRFVKDEELRDPSGYYQGRVEVLNQANEGRIQLTAPEREHLLNLYDAEVAWVDSKIRDIVADIKERGLWDHTVVVLNADHGEGFGEHGRYYHGLSLYEDQILVPLIIKPPLPPDGGWTIHGSVRNLDIMPTILDYCGIAPPGDLNGQSLRSFLEKRSSPNLPACLETFGFWKGLGSEFKLAAIRQDGYKLIIDPLKEQMELYHLAEDPGEKHNLLIGEPPPAVLQRSSQLEEELFSTLQVSGLNELRPSRRDLMMDRATTQQLKALGYIY